MTRQVYGEYTATILKLAEQVRDKALRNLERERSRPEPDRESPEILDGDSTES